mgnify:FL=1
MASAAHHGVGEPAGVRLGAGVTCGVRAGVDAGVPVGVRAGLAVGVRAGVAAGVRAGEAAGVARGVWAGVGVRGAAAGVAARVGVGVAPPPRQAGRAVTTSASRTSRGMTEPIREARTIATSFPLENGRERGVQGSRCCSPSTLNTARPGKFDTRDRWNAVVQSAPVDEHGSSSRKGHEGWYDEGSCHFSSFSAWYWLPAGRIHRPRHRTRRSRSPRRPQRPLRPKLGHRPA